MRAITATPSFQRDVKKLPREILDRADLAIQTLRAEDPAPNLDIKKLRLSGRPLFRVRVGDYRLVYSFDGDSLLLLAFRHRKDVYKGLERFL